MSRFTSSEFQRHLRMNDLSTELYLAADIEKWEKELAPRAAKLFSLRFNPNDQDQITRLTARGHLSVREAARIKMLYRMAEEIYPGQVSTMFDLKPEYDVFINDEYGYNPTVARRIRTQFYMFKRFKVTRFYIVIRFPQFRISNGIRSRELRDLFVRVPISIDSDNLFFKDIEGTKTTFSATEFRGGYVHSHLSSRDMTDTSKDRLAYDGFCTGTGDIVAAMSQLNGAFDEDNYKLFLLQIQPYVEWESLDGGPYMKIGELGERIIGTEHLSLDSLVTVYTTFRDKLIRRNRNGGEFIPDLNWTFSGGRYVLINDYKIDELCKDLLEENYHTLFYYKNDEGKFFKTKTLRRMREQFYDHNPNEWIPFRGQKIHLQVTRENVEEDNNFDRTLFIHPQFRNYVISRLEYQANQAKTKEFGLRRASEGGVPR